MLGSQSGAVGCHISTTLETLKRLTHCSQVRARLVLEESRSVWIALLAISLQRMPTIVIVLGARLWCNNTCMLFIMCYLSLIVKVALHVASPCCMKFGGGPHPVGPSFVKFSGTL